MSPEPWRALAATMQSLRAAPHVEALRAQIAAALPQIIGTSGTLEIEGAAEGATNVVRLEAGLPHERAVLALERAPEAATEELLASLAAAVALSLDRLAAEARTEQERERQTRIFESITDAFFIIDRQWRFTYINRTAEAFIGAGRTREEMLGKSLLELFPAARGTLFEYHYARAMNEGVTAHFVAHYPPPLDAWYEVRAYPSEDGVAVYFQNVNELVNSRQAADEQRRWFESILNLLPVPVIFLEPGTAKVTFSNAAADRMAGGETAKQRPSEEYHLVYRITDEQDVPLPNEQVPGVRAARGEELEGAEAVWHTPAGRFSFVAHSRMVAAAHGRPATAVLAFQDVTPLKTVQRELNEAIHARDLFLSLASHELRTPLTAMRLQVQSLERRLQREGPATLSPERITRFVGQMDRSLLRLGHLVEDMLDVSRIQSGKLALNPESVEIAALIADVTERLSPSMAAAGMKLELELHPARGLWDRHRLEQILVNLIANAIRYAPGKPLRISTCEAKGMLELRVSDRGPGVPEEHRERIFQRFERAVDANEISGLGLGLYISREISHAHGGELSVEPSRSEGATFLLRLPLGP